MSGGTHLIHVVMCVGGGRGEGRARSASECAVSVCGLGVRSYSLCLESQFSVFIVTIFSITVAVYSSRTYIITPKPEAVK